jgi:4'-phosphopantetheinyl transferase
MPLVQRMSSRASSVALLGTGLQGNRRGRKSDSLAARFVDLSTLDHQECERAFHAFAADWQRLRFASLRLPAQKLRYARAHGGVRILLARASDRSEAAVQLLKDRNGKPMMDGGPAFSLSHCGERSAVAISTEGDVGLDLVRLSETAAGLAPGFARLDEMRAVSASCGIRPGLDVGVWAIKEAAAKLTGAVLREPESWQVGCERGLLVVESSWFPRIRIDLLFPDPDHLAAVAQFEI